MSAGPLHRLRDNQRLIGRFFGEVAAHFGECNTSVHLLTVDHWQWFESWAASWGLASQMRPCSLVIMKQRNDYQHFQ